MLNSVDGDGDQLLEAVGDEQDDPETQEAERAERGRKSSEKFPKKIARGYI